MNEQEQFDNYKIMNLADLPDRYFVANEQKMNYLPENFLEFDQDSFTIAAKKKTSQSDLLGIEYQSLKDRYIATTNNFDNINNINETCEINEQDMDSGFRLTRQEYDRLVKREQLKQERKQMRQISQLENKSEITVNSSSNQNLRNIDIIKTTNHNNNNNNNTYHNVTAFGNDAKRISSKNSPVLSV